MITTAPKLGKTDQGSCYRASYSRLGSVVLSWCNGVMTETVTATAVTGKHMRVVLETGHKDNRGLLVAGNGNKDHGSIAKEATQ